MAAESERIVFAVIVLMLFFRAITSLTTFPNRFPTNPIDPSLPHGADQSQP
jgi:hypothetical protein